MSFKITGLPQSVCTIRVMEVLAEKGVTNFEMYKPNMAAKEHKSKVHTDKQPFGVIPILEDDGLTLYESRAICRYLAIKFHSQGMPLVPALDDQKGWAFFEQHASVEVTHFDAFANLICMQKVFNPMKGLPTDNAVLEFAMEGLKQKLVIFNTILGKQAYMGGEVFSLIDIFYMPLMRTLFKAGSGNLIEGAPNVNEWWQKVSGRDSWRKVTQA